MSDRLERVVQNYEIKLRLGAGGKLSEHEIRKRVDGYSRFAVNDDLVLTQVRQVLCMHGIVPMVFPAYHAFSRELGKLTRQDISAESQGRMMMVLLEKWAMRGLSQKALLDIAVNVFNIKPPDSPDGMS
jgi:hypothetical protein